MQRNGHFISNLDALDISDQIIDYEFALYNAYPNPFNPTTTIEYEVPFSMDVILNVYDISGKLVKTLVNDMKNNIYYFLKRINKTSVPASRFYISLLGIMSDLIEDN